MKAICGEPQRGEQGVKPLGDFGGWHGKALYICLVPEGRWQKTNRWQGPALKNKLSGALEDDVCVGVDWYPFLLLSMVVGFTNELLVKTNRSNHLSHLNHLNHLNPSYHLKGANRWPLT